ncbi:ribonuclease E/G, partial [Streptomyces violarus]|nr:ribonuclease E/G [Streptomyces violarus]
MLEPTEPIEGSEQNTPSDTLPPRRRRRAASRPAGPPVGGTSDAPVETVAPAIPAADPDELATEVVDAGEEAAAGADETSETAQAAEAVASAEEAAPAARKRRRAVRRASAPAGTPEATEAAETVVPVTATAPADSEASE